MPPEADNLRLPASSLVQHSMCEGLADEFLRCWKGGEAILSDPRVDAGLATAALVVGAIAFRGKGEATLSRILPEVSIVTEKSAIGAVADLKAVSATPKKIVYFDRDLLDPSLPEQSHILRDVFRADQADAAHTKSFDCYMKLEQSTSKFLGTNLEPHFHNALSLESFHMGQFSAMQLGNNKEALTSFEHSLQHASDASQFWSRRGDLSRGASEGEWFNYVRGTIAYMNGDVEGVGIAQLAVTDGINKQKLGNFKDGLNEFGTVDYSRDYLKPSRQAGI